MSSQQLDPTGTAATFPRDPKFYLDTVIFLVRFQTWTEYYSLVKIPTG
jgi:hypothetical protein